MPLIVDEFAVPVPVPRGIVFVMVTTTVVLSVVREAERDNVDKPGSWDETVVLMTRTVVYVVREYETPGEVAGSDPVDVTGGGGMLIMGIVGIVTLAFVEEPLLDFRTVRVTVRVMGSVLLLQRLEDGTALPLETLVPGLPVPVAYPSDRELMRDLWQAW